MSDNFDICCCRGCPDWIGILLPNARYLGCALFSEPVFGIHPNLGSESWNTIVPLSIVCDALLREVDSSAPHIAHPKGVYTVYVSEASVHIHLNEALWIDHRNGTLEMTENSRATECSAYQTIPLADVLRACYNYR